MQPKGIILSGGPSSVYAEHAPLCDPAIWELGIPVLGVCYGMQLMVQQLGGVVEAASGKAEYGKAPLEVDRPHSRPSSPFSCFTTSTCTPEVKSSSCVEGCFFRCI